MLADSDIQVWLDTQHAATQAVIVPYVQSAIDARLQYRISLVQRSGGNTSQVSQQGVVELTAGQPARISRLTVNATPDGSCNLDIVLRDQGNELARFNFDCSLHP